MESIFRLDWAAGRAIDVGFQPEISLRALQFYGDGTLARVPIGMQQDLTRWAKAVNPGKLPYLRSHRGLVPGRLGPMSTLTAPYPAELMRIARKVVWYDAPEETLRDLKTFLAHLMVYGSVADVEVVIQYISMEEFRKVLKDAPAGVFTAEAWARWHERFGLEIPPLSRRGFPDGSLGPDPGDFFGR